MNEIKPFLVRKSTFISNQEFIDITPNIFTQTAANEELKESFEKFLDPLLKKAKFINFFRYIFSKIKILGKIFQKLQLSSENVRAKQ